MRVSKVKPKDMVSRPFDYTRLRKRIHDVYGECKEYVFAGDLGVSPKALSDWLNNKHYFRMDCISIAAELLEIPETEIGAYFFTRLVQNN